MRARDTGIIADNFEFVSIISSWVLSDGSLEKVTRNMAKTSEIMPRICFLCNFSLNNK